MTNNMEGTFPEMEPHQAMKAFSFACEPEAVTDVIYFLAGHESRHINGAEIRVDKAQRFKCPICRPIIRNQHAGRTARIEWHLL